MPYNRLSLYKKFVFPIVEKHGLVPVAADEFVLPAENTSAKLDALIQKSKLIIADISTNNPSIHMQLGMVYEKRKQCLVISKPGIPIPFNLNNQVIISDFEYNIDELLVSIENFVGKFGTRSEDFMDEPRRLFRLKEYNAAVISAIRLLEVKLTKQWLSEEKYDTNSSTVVPLTQLLKIVDGKYNINITEVKEWLLVRNKVVHSEYQSSKSQSKKIIDGVYGIISKLQS